MESYEKLPVRKFAVCTTFNQAGYLKYGKNMIDSFVKNWPKSIDLYVYAEDCDIVPLVQNVYVLNSHLVNHDLVNFKNKWKDDPKANGDIRLVPGLQGRKDVHKSFKWDAIRFSNKVYSIVHCSRSIDADALLWMDADMVCHSPISEETLERLCPTDIDIAFLGRERKFTECGLYYINLNSEISKNFLDKFQYYYDNAENGIFKLSEWHDSFVFDEVRKSFSLKELNWSQGLIKGEGHPLINCEWGAYLDHLKGDRKNIGRSLPKDLIINRTESYWKTI